MGKYTDWGGRTGSWLSGLEARKIAREIEARPGWRACPVSVAQGLGAVEVWTPDKTKYRIRTWDEYEKLREKEGLT